MKCFSCRNAFFTILNKVPGSSTSSKLGYTILIFQDGSCTKTHIRYILRKLGNKVKQAFTRTKLRIHTHNCECDTHSMKTSTFFVYTILHKFQSLRSNSCPQSSLFYHTDTAPHRGHFKQQELENMKTIIHSFSSYFDQSLVLFLAPTINQCPNRSIQSSELAVFGIPTFSTQTCSNYDLASIET